MAVTIKSEMKVKTQSPLFGHPLCMSLRIEILGNADWLYHFPMTKNLLK